MLSTVVPPRPHPCSSPARRHSPPSTARASTHPAGSERAGPSVRAAQEGAPERSRVADPPASLQTRRATEPPIRTKHPRSTPTAPAGRATRGFFTRRKGVGGPTRIRRGGPARPEDARAGRGGSKNRATPPARASTGCAPTRKKVSAPRLEGAPPRSSTTRSGRPSAIPAMPTASSGPQRFGGKHRHQPSNRRREAEGRPQTLQTSGAPGHLHERPLELGRREGPLRHPREHRRRKTRHVSLLAIGDPVQPRTNSTAVTSSTSSSRRCCATPSGVNGS